MGRWLVLAGCPSAAVRGLTRNRRRGRRGCPSPTPSQPAQVLKRQQHNSLARLVARLAPCGDRGARYTRVSTRAADRKWAWLALAALGRGHQQAHRLGAAAGSSAVCVAGGWAPMAMSSGPSSASGRSAVCVARARHVPRHVLLPGGPGVGLARAGGP